MHACFAPVGPVALAEVEMIDRQQLARQALRRWPKKNAKTIPVVRLLARAGAGSSHRTRFDSHGQLGKREEGIVWQR